MPDSQVTRLHVAFSTHSTPIDDIAPASGLSTARCAAILAELELSGEAVTLAGGLAVRAILLARLCRENTARSMKMP